MRNKFRIAVLSQSDSFVIPKNIKLLSDMADVNLVTVVNIDSGGSLVNKKSLFLRGFGIVQIFKMSLLISINKTMDLIDSIFHYRLGFCKSLKSVAIVSAACYKTVDNPNDTEFVQWLEESRIDLIVSYSAPCVFREALLSAPKQGCINLHCSLLPNYAGLLPSFWALFEKADRLGATVHIMDNRIDNGEILGQVEVPIPLKPTMFSVINTTKSAGGKLMVSIVKEYIRGEVTKSENSVSKESYYSWPTIEQIHKFRSDGGRLL